MKTLIYQINIGQSTQWESNKISKALNHYLIPSVKNYAKKNNYDYRIYKEDIFQNFGKNFLNSKGTYLAFNKWLYLKYLDYDRIVYFDTDIYIFENAEKLPLANDFLCVAEPKECETQSLYRDYYSLDENYRYINSGFFICNKEAAQKISSYMIKRIRFKKKGKPKNTDNGLLNEFLLENKNFKFKLLDKKWNYFPQINQQKKIKLNCIHFVGIDGSQYLSKLLNNNINLNELLEQKFNG